MKHASNCLCCLSILFWSSIFAGDFLSFESPFKGDPSFRIYCLIDFLENETIKKLKLNGSPIERYWLLKDDKVLAPTGFIESGIYELALDYAWKNKKKYELEVLIEEISSKKLSKYRIADFSPLQGGIVHGEEGFSQTLHVKEPIGLSRTNEVVVLSLTAPTTEIRDKNFVIYMDNTLLPYQFLESKENVPDKTAQVDHPSTLTVSLAVPITLKPLESKILIVLKGKKQSTSSPGFTIEGKGLGKRVSNGNLLFEFDSQSGQLKSILDQKENLILQNPIGTLHWNPDVYIPNIAWDHSFDWKPPPSYQENEGPFFWIQSRKGSMPIIKDIFLEVQYTLQKETRYLVSETRMTPLKQLSLAALRNDEMVVDHKLFDHLIYSSNGKVTILPLKPQPKGFQGLYHVAPFDADWVGFVHSKQNIGFFSLRLEHSNQSFDGSPLALHKPGTYFYAPDLQSYIYWVRALFYTWGEFATSNFLTFVPKGSSFYEKNAYLFLQLKEGYLKEVEGFFKKLKFPARVDS